MTRYGVLGRDQHGLLVFDEGVVTSEVYLVNVLECDECGWQDLDSRGISASRPPLRGSLGRRLRRRCRGNGTWQTGPPPKGMRDRATKACARHARRGVPRYLPTQL